VGENITDFKPGDAVFGRVQNGCAEEVAATTDLLWHLPAGVDYAVAAGFGMNYGTSYYALKERGQLKAGETLLVLGASGGVGMAAIDLGRMMGARIIACASTAEKLAICKQAGADELINYETENLRDRIKELTGDRGVDVVYDPVGDKFADPAVRSLAWGGRYLVVGFAAGEIPRVALNLPLLKGSSVVGVWWGGLINKDPARARHMTEELVQMIAAGKIKPYISATYPLARTADAFKDMLSRKVTGKIVVITQDREN
jgi:NADPH2:quinone reductase